MKKLLLSLVAILFAINIYAQPSTITYQGVLTNAGGAVVTETPNITFALFDAETNGNQLWTETHNNVSVTNGLFQVELNSVAANWGTANFATDIWLQITVGATTLSPRVKFNAGGYSFRSDQASSATNFTGNLVGDVSGTQGATVIGSGKVTNDMLAGTIADTKLSTITTAGKVANSATTATNANTSNAIVARDASGNFSASTITANLTGTSSTATNITGGANGSIPYQTASGTTAMLAAGTNGYVLTLSGGVPTWAAPSGGGGITVGNTPGEGDLVYYSSGNWIARRLTLANTGSGTAVSVMQPFLALHYCIALEGMYPIASSESPFMGEIDIFAFNTLPSGYARCDGTQLAVNSYQTLYSLLGVTYGGTAPTSFKLPDLRGRTPIGTGQGASLTNRVLGASGGAETVTISISNLPSHNHTITYED